MGKESGQKHSLTLPRAGSGSRNTLKTARAADLDIRRSSGERYAHRR